jgi:hypothetical protein
MDLFFDGNEGQVHIGLYLAPCPQYNNKYSWAMNEFAQSIRGGLAGKRALWKPRPRCFLILVRSCARTNAIVFFFDSPHVIRAGVAHEERHGGAADSNGNDTEAVV